MNFGYNVRIIALSAAFSMGLIMQATNAKAAGSETLLVAGGCFWCVESDFESVKGVKEVISGFAGGTVKNPTYKQVTAGGTGHYEVAQIQFDPAVVSLDQLLSMFFRSVDPTDAGGQFCDRGDSYRTAIFAKDAAQQSAANKAKAQAQAALGQKIVTPVLGKTAFYPADAYHQDYYKSSERLAFSSVGLAVKKSVAYKRYRDGCGREVFPDQTFAR